MLDAAQTTQTVTLRAADMRRAMAFAAQASYTWQIIPILKLMRLTVAGNRATFRATCLDIEAAHSCDASQTPGIIDITLPPKPIMQMIRWAKDDVALSISGKILTVTVDDMQATFRLLCPATDWPEMNPILDPVPYDMPEAVLHKATHQTFPCISTEETRYYLNGAYWHAFDGKLRLVTTDGYRMAIYDTGAAYSSPSQIVPRLTLSILLRILRAGGNRPVTVTATGNPEQYRIAFAGDDWSIQSKTVNGTFPDYTRTQPKGEPTVTATITDEALRRFPTGSSMHSRIKINPVSGRMSIDDNDSEGSYSMAVQATGDRAFNFNLHYLRQMTSRVGTVRIEQAKDRDPARVLTDDPALQLILMPML